MRFRIPATHRITTIEPVPSDPEDTSADQNKSKIVRPVLATIDSMTRTDESGGYEPGRTRRDMDDITARVIDDTELVEEASTPDGKSDDRVGERDP